MRDLASRLRSIVQQEASRAPVSERPLVRELSYVAEGEEGGDIARAADGLGGLVHTTDRGACVVVDRLWPAEAWYGCHQVGECAMDRDAPIALFDRRLEAHATWAEHVVFLDIETTGLSGGAGTLAFLVGVAWFEDGAFRVRQFFLNGPAGERAMLDALAELFGRTSLLVTFNGRAFDVPVMDMRWAFHRLPTPTEALPHFDMLPPARRLWGEPGQRAGQQQALGESQCDCSLTALERSLLGLHRYRDVAGFEIPTRYFQYLRTGDVRVVEGVLDHNRHDLVSLAAITSRALALARVGPAACQTPSELLGLGRLYERMGNTTHAARAFELAADAGHRAIRRQALAGLAILRRREGRFDDAAAAWQHVLTLTAEDEATPLGRRAAEALAIHHEHRARDLETARRYAEVLSLGASGQLRAEARHRLDRLDRKLSNRRKRDEDLRRLTGASDETPST